LILLLLLIAFSGCADHASDGNPLEAVLLIRNAAGYVHRTNGIP
jgi:hypothetical protein